MSLEGVNHVSACYHCRDMVQAERENQSEKVGAVSPELKRFPRSLTRHSWGKLVTVPTGGRERKQK